MKRDRPDAHYETHVLYRRPAITEEHIGHFVDVLLRELFDEDNGSYHDAVHVAFAESGLGPAAPLMCKSVHLDTQTEHLNHLADALRAAIQQNREVRRTLQAVVTVALCALTTVAPDRHLANDEVAELAVCCGKGDDHIADYSVYARRLAHVGVCARCAMQSEELMGSPAVQQRVMHRSHGNARSSEPPER